MSKANDIGVEAAMQQVDDACADYLVGQINRRELLAVGARLGVGVSVLASAAGALAITRPALAAGSTAEEIMARIHMPYIATHDAPAPGDRTMVPAGKYKKPGPWTIGFSNNYSSNSWRTNMLWCLRYYATQHKDKIKKFYYTDSNQSIPQQISDMQSLQARGADVVLLEPGAGTSLNAIITRISAAGIPVVPFDGVVQGAPYALWVGMNLRYIGTASAAFLINKLSNKGNILICRGMAGNLIDTLWWSDAEKLIHASDLKIIGQVYTNWDFATAKSNVSKFLASHPGEIHGVWNENGGAAMGVIEAFQEAGRTVPPTMGDQNNGFLKKWQELAKKSGYEAHGYIYPTWLSSNALAAAFKILAGEPVYHEDFRPQLVITNDNLAKYVRPNLPASYFSADYLPDDWVKKMYSEKINFNIHAS
ncbi:MAG: substrate-binding domain-containing protein [Acetobacteraceae bacterium]